MAQLTANGIHLEYEAHGNPHDPAVLLVMGLGMQMIAWPEQFVSGLVEQGFYVICFDNRDCGLSGKLAAAGVPNLPLTYLKRLVGWPIKPPYSLDDMAADALGLLDALQLRRAHVIGVSMGGMIAQLLAARHPARILSLTSMMSTSGRRGLPGPTPVVRRAMLRAPKRPSREQLIAHMVALLRLIGSPAYPIPEPQLRAQVAVALDRQQYPDGVARQLQAILGAADRDVLLRGISCPALVIHGDADPLLPLACGSDTAALIPGARLQVIEGMGHDLPPQLMDRLLSLIGVHLHGKMWTRNLAAGGMQ